MNTTLLIARDSVRSLVRQKLLLGVMLAALVLTGIFSAILVNKRNMAVLEADTSSPAAENATVGANHSSSYSTKKRSKEQEAQLAEAMEGISSTLQSVFYEIASFGGSLVSLFIFSTAASSEIRRGTVKITLTKPVSRTQFLAGKYLGGIAVMAAYAIVSSAALILFAKSGHLSVSPAMSFAPWLMFCRQLMLGALAMVLSLFVHPFLASVIAFFATNSFYNPPNPLYYLFPSYSPFDTFGAMMRGTLMSSHDLLMLSLYAADFVALMLILALWRFRAKELL